MTDLRLLRPDIDINAAKAAVDEVELPVGVSRPPAAPLRVDEDAAARGLARGILTLLAETLLGRA
jgi:hypothetical protein